MFGKRRENFQQEQEQDQFENGRGPVFLDDGTDDQHLDIKPVQPTQIAPSYNLNGMGNVIWQGNSSTHTSNIALKIGKTIRKIFGTIWLLFSLIWAGASFSVSFIMGLFSLPFIAMGVYMVSGKSGFPVSNYTLTDKALIVGNSKNRRTKIVVPLNQVTDAYCTNENAPYSDISIRYKNPRGANITINMMGIENPGYVYQLICDAVRRELGQ